MLNNLLSPEIYNEIISTVSLDKLTEVRLRVNLPIAIKKNNERILLKTHANQRIIDNIVAKATNYSLYAYQEELASGYIHCQGGLRLGVAGRGVTEGGKIIAFKNITSINIRIPHQIIGCSDPLKDIMRDFQNTIVIAPPFAGKTTLIRDMARVLSDRYDLTIVDERDEIAGKDLNFTFGKFCDIVSGVPKGLAYEGIIRALSPEIIVLDELFPAKDLSSVQEISRSGIKFLASFHGDSIDYFTNTYKDLAKLFTHGVLLSYKPNLGSIKSIVRFKID